jgi:predicted RNA binding protein YcfA (HicA-like mRNA interferase family)
MGAAYRPEQVIRFLLKNGFERVGQKGSHRKFRKAGRVVIVPMHSELATGTLMAILKQAGLTLAALRQSEH